MFFAEAVDMKENGDVQKKESACTMQEWPTRRGHTTSAG